MRLLLDTHTFLWLDGSPEHLSPAALAACEDPTNQLYLSGKQASIRRFLNAETQLSNPQLLPAECIGRVSVVPA
jgi:hypothetical protein